MFGKKEINKDDPDFRDVILKVYAVYDSAMHLFMNPFFQVGKGVAFRMFQDAVNDPKSPFYLHPECYSLFELGEWNESKGCFVNKLAPEMVVTAQELAAAKPKAEPLRVI